jgi:site-specific recombinase XerD
LDLTRLTGQLAPRSLTAYQQDLAAYLHFCSEPGTALEATSLTRWRLHLARHTPLAPSTINRRLAAVRRVVQEAAEHGVVDRATAAAFRQVQGVSVKALKDRLRARIRITAGQMRRLCEAPDLTTLKGVRDRALLHTLASSGCRVSEIVSLTTAQIRSDAGSFFLEVLGKNQTTPRLAPLSHEAYAAMQAWLARQPVASASVFTSFAGRGPRVTGGPMSTTAVWQLVQHYAHQVGLTHVSPHSFRRFVGTELAKRDIRQAQKALGHARLETTARHYVLDELAGGLTDGLY